MASGRIASLIVLGLGLAGCARNAVFEVDLTIPPQTPGEPLFALVQVENGSVLFEDDWQSGSREGIPLTGSTQTLHYSIVTEDPTTVVQLKVRFCVSSFCDSLPADDPARGRTVGYRFERAFYVGERTRWRGTIATLPDPAGGTPTAPIEIGRCEVEGCIQGAGATSFCRLSGEHFCE